MKQKGAKAKGGRPKEPEIVGRFRGMGSKEV